MLYLAKRAFYPSPPPFPLMHEDIILSVAKERDVQRLYNRVRSGQLKNFTGIESPYEAPETPEIHIDTTSLTIEQSANEIVNFTVRKF